MELLIVIGLLIIIILLLKDKIVVNRTSGGPPRPEQVNPELPDIMGQPKAKKRYPGQDTAAGAPTPPTLMAERNKKESEAVLPAEGVPAAVAGVDLAAEEEAWGATGMADGGFATGVTFDELAMVGKLMAQESVGPSEKATAVSIASKIEGTALAALLESRISDAAQKIAALLDSSMIQQGDEHEDKDFDISDHI